MSDLPPSTHTNSSGSGAWRFAVLTQLCGALACLSCSDDSPSGPRGNVVAASGASGSGGQTTGQDNSAGASYEMGALRAAAKRAGKLLGVAVDAKALASDTNYSTLVGEEFDYVTAENAMKWGPLAPTATTYAFEDADAIVAFAASHQQLIKGHTLIWHNQLPSWVDEAMSADELRAALKQHIETTLKHYRGKVRAWDVVNEAIDVAAFPGDSTGAIPTQAIFTDSIFYRKLGMEYIEEAFRIAHAADPDALLFYNELGIERDGLKAQKTQELIEYLIGRGVPIHGIGLQSHITMHRYPSEFHLRNRIRAYAQLGLKVNISELDVQTLRVPADQATRWQAQRVPFQQVVGICITEPDCEGVTLWGVTDRYANDVVAGDQPFLFDQQYGKKPAYDGVLAGLSGVLPAYGPNLVKEGNFEADGLEWTTSGGTLSPAKLVGVDARGHACVTGRTLAGHGFVQDMMQALSSGGQFAFSASVRLISSTNASSVTGPVEFAVTIRTQTDASADNSLGTVAAKDGEWAQLSGNFGLPVAANAVGIDLKIYGPPAGIDLCVSDVRVQALTIP